MAEAYEDRGVVSREPGAVVADSKPRPKGTRRRWFLRSWGVDDQRQDNGRTSFSGETILTGPRPSDKSATSRAKLGADSRRRWVATLTGVRVWGSRRLRRTRMIGESVRVAERRPDRVGAALGPAGRELLRAQIRLGSFSAARTRNAISMEKAALMIGPVNKRPSEKLKRKLSAEKVALPGRNGRVARL